MSEFIRFERKPGKDTIVRQNEKKKQFYFQSQSHARLPYPEAFPLFDTTNAQRLAHLSPPLDTERISEAPIYQFFA